MGNMAEPGRPGDRVAVLVDCDNTPPEMLEYALSVGEQFGRVVLRRGYGNHSTLANKWQDALIRHAFSPCLQYQYAAGKNTSDIALAMDALEDSFERRADIFCLVTSDSDFVYLCRKLRERGATVCIVGARKTPEALRHASQRFFEYPEADAGITTSEPAKVIKRRPKTLLSAVSHLAVDAAEGWVRITVLGQHMHKADPDFKPKKYGHSGLQEMVFSYPELETRMVGKAYWVKPKTRTDVKEPNGERQAAAA
jgi:uncharacterized protein (TIGR00288 family)